MSSAISIVGLGKLGLCMAAVFAERGFKVIGVDIDKTKVQLINEGRSPIFEPGLNKLLKKNKKRIEATINYEKAIINSKTTFVVVPTPSTHSGAYSLRYVKQAMRSIGKVLSRKDEYHTVALTSTVLPGSMEGAVKPVLEKSSGKTCGKDFGLCYNPAFIALGDVINGLLRPDFILIGESDSKSGKTIAAIHRKTCLNSPPIERMNFINAEIAKIAINSFVTMKMSFANTLAEICEKIKNADVDKVTYALGRDKRIGPAYLKGALGYGGPCFPRDNLAFMFFARRIGAQAELPHATHKVNNMQLQRIFELLNRLSIKPPTSVGILGLAYKPNTNVVEKSQSILLAEMLAKQGFKVNVYDPVAMDEARAILGQLVNYEKSIHSCIDKSDICIIATPWRSFRKINKHRLGGKTIIDCWRLLDRKKLPRSANYIALGRDIISQTLLNQQQKAILTSLK